MLLCIDAGSEEADDAQFRLFYAPVSDPVWLTLKVFFMLLTVVGMGLLGHLLGFHILLCECSVLIIPREAEGYSVELFGLSVRPSVCPSVRLSVCLSQNFVRTSSPSCHLSANRYLYHMKAN